MPGSELGKHKSNQIQPTHLPTVVYPTPMYLPLAAYTTRTYLLLAAYRYHSYEPITNLRNTLGLKYFVGHIIQI